MQPYSPTNRPWEIIGGADGTLRIGRQRLPLGSIRGVSMSAAQEKDFLGSLLNYSAYLIVAAIFMVLVVQAGWRERFLLATVFFAIVGLTSMIDIVLATRVKLYRLQIATASGAIVDFVSADAAEVDRLAAALKRAGRT
jgi:Family of unknown function (DUF6232)